MVGLSADKKNLQREEIDVQLYSRYVDDIVCVLGGREAGIGEKGKLWSQVQQVANSIHQSIQVTQRITHAFLIWMKEYIVCFLNI